MSSSTVTREHQSITAYDIPGVMIHYTGYMNPVTLYWSVLLGMGWSFECDEVWVYARGMGAGDGVP